MNNIITQKRLVELIASTAQCSSETAQAYIVAFTNQIKNALQRDKTVQIKDLGEFSVNATGDRIIFVPEPRLAEAINAPFAMFEPEDLAPGISTEELTRPVAPVVVPEAPEAPQPAETAEAPEMAEQAEATEEAETPDATVPLESEKIPDQMPEEAPDPEPEPEPASEPEPAPEPEPAHIEHHTHHSHAHTWEESEEEEESAERLDKGSAFPTFWLIIGLVAGLFIGCCIGFFLHDPIQEKLEPALIEDATVEISEADMALLDILSEEEQPAAQTEEQPAPTQPAAAPASEKAVKAAQEPAKAAQEATPKPAAKADVYDTVTSNLAALSKKHYGDKVYWVYIYLENQKIIPNPNRVGENVRLKIPPLEKYATQATEAERKAAARKKEAEILAKYK